jgi:hypothetical protein
MADRCDSADRKYSRWENIRRENTMSILSEEQLIDEIIHWTELQACPEIVETFKKELLARFDKLKEEVGEKGNGREKTFGYY